MSAAPTVTAGQTPSAGRSFTGQIAEPLQRLIRAETGSASLLLVATIAALVWANAAPDEYASFWGTELSLRLSDSDLTLDLRHWVNDGLMAVFFFVIGLEVKRELVMGELTDRRRAAVPLVAAIAGLVIPALLFVLVAPSGEAANAWGVVISTDTAFALGILALVGRHAPTQLRVFLLTMAVADDVGALTVIAFVYTENLDVLMLGIVAASIGVMVLLRLAGVWLGPPYLVVALGAWLAMYESGVHPTVAGVLVAFLPPAHPPRREDVERAARAGRAFRQAPSPESARHARRSVQRAISTNERLLRRFIPWTSYGVVPVFALANAGVTLDGDAIENALSSSLTLAIVLGLVVGKLVGVGLAAWGTVRIGLGSLGRGLGTAELAGGAALTGIGFTISLFVVDLAIEDPALAEEARIGVLVASILAALIGALFFTIGRRVSVPVVDQPDVLDDPVDLEDDHIRGPLNAALTLVEYSDYECPYCGRSSDVVEDLHAHFGDRLRYVVRHLPLDHVHPEAALAAEAVEAAGAQGRFWEMHERLFDHQDALSPEDLVDHAEAIGLDTERFAEDLRSGVHGPRVRRDIESAEASGATGTPTFFIGGARHSGATDAQSLIAALEASADDGPG